MEISNIKQPKVIMFGKYVGYLHGWDGGKAIIECGQDVNEKVFDDKLPRKVGEIVLLHTNQFRIDRSIQSVKK